MMPLSGRNALRHAGPISGVAVRGLFVATAGYDNQVILWDAADHTPLARGQHDHLVNQCAFSSDGRWLVSASSDYSARIWSVPEMRLHAVLAGHGDDVDMAVFSPDDTRIATCALDRCVRIFDRDGRCLRTMHGHTGNVLSIAWSPDGREVVSSSVDGTVRRWDAATGAPAGLVDLQVRTDTVEIGPDGTVYAGDDRGRIALIGGPEGGDGVPRFIQLHRAGVKKIALDAYGETLVSMSYDQSIATWRIGGPNRLMLLARSTLPESVWARACAVLDDGRVVTGTFGSRYAVFDPVADTWDLRGVAAGDAINAVLQVGSTAYTVGDAGRVLADGELMVELGSLCNFLTTCGQRVFTGGQLGILFDAHTGAPVHQHHSPLNCGVSFVRRNVPHLAVGTYTGEVLVFAQGAGGVMRLETTLHVYENAVKGLSCSDGELFSVCASTEIAWHRVDDWSLLRRHARAHERIANACCAIGPRRFATVGRDRSLRLWNADGAELVEVHASPHRNSVKCMGIDDAQTAVLTGSYGGTLALFDLQHRRWTAFTRPTAAGISSITWDRERRRFLASSYDGGVYPVSC
jgi:toxoflavin biosynthesis protein ToxC